jgi:hypothetical protein
MAAQVRRPPLTHLHCCRNKSQAYTSYGKERLVHVLLEGLCCSNRSGWLMEYDVFMKGVDRAEISRISLPKRTNF